MELTLNLIWMAIAAVAFVAAPRRSMRVSIALVCGLALLFPIISASDDLNADRTFNDAAAAIVVTIVLLLALVAIARIRVTSAPLYAVHLATPSDPRSPPAR
jgi:uncharacterized membrane protein